MLAVKESNCEHQLCYVKKTFNNVCFAAKQLENRWQIRRRATDPRQKNHKGRLAAGSPSPLPIILKLCFLQSFVTKASQDQWQPNIPGDVICPFQPDGIQLTYSYTIFSTFVRHAFLRCEPQSWRSTQNCLSKILET